MFKMIVRRKDGSEVTSGASLPGEDWVAALLRLFGEHAGDGIARTVLHPTEPRLMDGTSLVSIIPVVGISGGMDRMKATEVLVETDPPQLPVAE